MYQLQPFTDRQPKLKHVPATPGICSATLFRSRTSCNHCNEHRFQTALPKRDRMQLGPLPTWALNRDQFQPKLVRLNRFPIVSLNRDQLKPGPVSIWDVQLGPAAPDRTPSTGPWFNNTVQAGNGRKILSPAVSSQSRLASPYSFVQVFLVFINVGQGPNAVIQPLLKDFVVLVTGKDRDDMDGTHVCLEHATVSQRYVHNPGRFGFRE